MFGPRVETDGDAEPAYGEPAYAFLFLTSRTRPPLRSLITVRCRLSSARNRRERGGEAGVKLVTTCLKLVTNVW